jgi:Chromate transporter
VFSTATFLGYLLGGVPAAIVATAGIFLPSFVMVTALEPLVGRIRRSPWTGAALDGVTMATLGLMAGVTVDLGRAAITDPLTAVVAVWPWAWCCGGVPTLCGWCWPARSSASPTPWHEHRRGNIRRRNRLAEDQHPAPSRVDGSQPDQEPAISI